MFDILEIKPNGTRVARASLADDRDLLRITGLSHQDAAQIVSGLGDADQVVIGEPPRFEVSISRRFIESMITDEIIREYGGPMSEKEIAAELGITVSTVGVLKKRALDKIRKHPGSAALREYLAGRVPSGYSVTVETEISISIE